MKKENCDVSVVVVSYNTREMTLACLKSVYEETEGPTFEVIVFDNASKDNSAEAVASSFPMVRLIASDENLGFAVANNRAASHAQGKYILLLNPDTVVIGNAIGRIWAFAEKCPEIKVYGGRTTFSDGNLNPTSCWGDMTLWSLFCYTFGLRKLFSASALFNSESYGNWKRDSIREVGIVTGCFLLVPTELWMQLGGLSPHYFMYAEEADFCLRARALGARPTVFPDATIIHHGSASDPVAWEKQVKLLQGKVTLMYDHWMPIGRFFGIALLKMRAVNHFIAYTTLAAISGRAEYKNRAFTFAQVLKLRRVWQSGYSRGRERV